MINIYSSTGWSIGTLYTLYGVGGSHACGCIIIATAVSSSSSSSGGSDILFHGIG
jgi:hypothetical protein